MTRILQQNKYLEMLTFVVCMCLLLSYIVTQRTDLTIVPGSSGVNVVRAVLSKLDDSAIFLQSGNNDLTNVFLRNMAFVETRDGTDIPDNAIAMDGGIWKITDRQFQQTKVLLTRNSRVRDAIRSYLGQDWMNVVYGDLAKPLYSGLAARLYLTYIATSGVIPPTDRQGQFWSHTFQGSRGDIQRWMEAITLLRQTEGKVQ